MAVHTLCEGVCRPFRSLIGVQMSSCGGMVSISAVRALDAGLRVVPVVFTMQTRGSFGAPRPRALNRSLTPFVPSCSFGISLDIFATMPRWLLSVSSTVGSHLFTLYGRFV